MPGSLGSPLKVLLLSIETIIAYEEYRRLGCYSMLHPGTKLRIVALNPLLFDSMNMYLWKNTTNPLNVVSK